MSIREGQSDLLGPIEWAKKSRENNAQWSALCNQTTPLGTRLHISLFLGDARVNGSSYREQHRFFFFFFLHPEREFGPVQDPWKTATTSGALPEHFHKKFPFCGGDSSNDAHLLILIKKVDCADVRGILYFPPQLQVITQKHR